MPISSSMRSALGAGLLVCAVSIGIGAARAETVVASGLSVTLMTASSLDPTCHSQGAVTVNVIEAPRGGYLEVMQTKAYPNFNALNTRSRCNTMKLPATQVIYQSAGNYLGDDSVTLELIFPGGGARRVRMPISVRPATTELAPAPPPGALAVAPEPSPPSEPPKKVVHHKKSVIAAASDHHRCKTACVASGAKTPDHPKPQAAAPKNPLMNI